VKTKGELPVPYIAALIIAIIVIGVLIYWFFILTKEPINTFTLASCQARASIYCTSWATTGYNLDSDGNPQLVGKWEEDALGGKGCFDNNVLKTVDKTYCESLFGKKQ
jgi:hypothetical protein